MDCIACSCAYMDYNKSDSFCRLLIQLESIKINWFVELVTKQQQQQSTTKKKLWQSKRKSPLTLTYFVFTFDTNSIESHLFSGLLAILFLSITLDGRTEWVWVYAIKSFGIDPIHYICAIRFLFVYVYERAVRFHVCYFLFNANKKQATLKPSFTICFSFWSNRTQPNEPEREKNNRLETQNVCSLFSDNYY